jgi:hypothetical protein
VLARPWVLILNILYYRIIIRTRRRGEREKGKKSSGQILEILESQTEDFPSDMVEKRRGPQQVLEQTDVEREGMNLPVIKWHPFSRVLLVLYICPLNPQATQ